MLVHRGHDPRAVDQYPVSDVLAYLMLRPLVRDQQVIGGE